MQVRSLISKETPLVGSVESAVLALNARGLLELSLSGWIIFPDHSPETLEVILLGEHTRSREPIRVLAKRRPKPEVIKSFSDVREENLFGFQVNLPVPALLETEKEDFVIQCIVSDAGGKSVSCHFPVKPLRLPTMKGDDFGDSQIPLEVKNFHTPAAEAYLEMQESRVRMSLHLREHFDFPVVPNPKRSIIVLSHSSPEHGYACLTALIKRSSLETEVIFAYDPSHVKGYAYLSLFSGLKLAPLDFRKSFAANMNELLAVSRAEVVFFLDAEAEILPGSILNAEKLISSSQTIGGVGGMVLGVDGLVFESGCAIHADASFSTFGRSTSPEDDTIHFQRDVDFVGPLFFGSRRSTLLQVGAFRAELRERDASFIDLSMRIWENGYRMVYSPRIRMFHAGDRTPRVSEKERGILKALHHDYLKSRSLQREPNEISSFERSPWNARLLLIAENWTSLNSADEGRKFLSAFAALGLRTSVYLLENQDSVTKLRREMADEFPEVEFLIRDGVVGLAEHLASRSEYYDFLWTTSYRCLRFIQPWVRKRKVFGKSPRVIFDANFEIYPAETLPIERFGVYREVGKEISEKERFFRRALLLSGGGEHFHSPQEVGELLQAADMIVLRGKANLGQMQKFSRRRLLQLFEEDFQSEVLLSRKLSILLSQQAVLSFGPDEGDKPFVLEAPSIQKQNTVEEFLKAFDRSAEAEKGFTLETSTDSLVSVIIPIYNALEECKKCVESVLAASDIPFELILINDASTDLLVEPWLNSIEVRDCRYLKRLRILTNRKNLGFPETVNRGLALSRGHVVLLNSDTEVPQGWLSRMIRPLSADSRIGSATPFSNSATICSLPEFCVSQPLPENVSLQMMDDAARCLRQTTPLDIPTGVGFCMLMNGRAIEEVGFFDSEIFTRGYGEENDWCLRAVTQRYRNVLLPNIFVLHKEGASFGSVAKRERIEKNLQFVEALHSGYQAHIQQFIEEDPLSGIRNQILSHLSLARNDLPGVLYVSNRHLGGGSIRYFQQVLEERRNIERQYLLEVDEHEVRFFDYVNIHFSLKKIPKFSFALNEYTEYDFQKLLKSFGITSIFVNQLAGMEVKSICKFLKSSAVPYSVFLHDYFVACPSVTLTTSEFQYCGAEKDPKICSRCLRKGLSSESIISRAKSGYDIEQWREMFAEFLDSASSVITPSEAAQQILNSYFPNVSIATVPHKALQPISRTYSLDFIDGEYLHVTVLGAIGPQKGSYILNELIAQIRMQKLKIRVTILGYTNTYPYPYQSPDEILTVTGEYRPEEVSDLLALHRSALVLIPSIWPETFSYTTFEAMRSGYPVMAFDLGAPAEQIRSSRGGWLVQEMNSESLLKQLKYLAIHPEEILAAAQRAGDLSLARSNNNDQQSRNLAHSQELQLGEQKEMIQRLDALLRRGALGGREP